MASAGAPWSQSLQFYQYDVILAQGQVLGAQSARVLPHNLRALGKGAGSFQTSKCQAYRGRPLRLG
jgi:hypothetical protein